MRTARIWWTIVIALSPVVMLAGITAQRAMSFPEEDLPEALAWAVASSKELHSFLDGTAFSKVNAKLLGKVRGPKISIYDESDPSVVLSAAAKWTDKKKIARVGSLVVDAKTPGRIILSCKIREELFDELTEKKRNTDPINLGISIPDELIPFDPRPEPSGCITMIFLPIAPPNACYLVFRQNPFAWWPGQPRWYLIEEI